VADDGGARLESARESGLPVAGGGNPVAGNGGKARALERRGRRGAVMGEWTAPGSGPSAALVGDVHRARVAGGNGDGPPGCTVRFCIYLN
jgi:hypothetical protein